MKVLFLDVDGVLNRCGKSGQGLESDKVDLLRWIIDLTKCSVVVSSTWRKFPDYLDRLKQEFPIHDCTPVLVRGTRGDGLNRGDEIQAWLTTHPDETHFVILDDDCDMGDLLPHLVPTDSFVGLTPEIASEVINRFNSPSQNPLPCPSIVP